MAKILIIENDEKYLKTIKTILEFQCHEVTTAKDLSMGARLYRENPTDIIVTDMINPERMGVSTLNDLKQFDPDARIIPVEAAIGDYQRSTKIIGVSRPVQHYFFHNPPLGVDDDFDSNQN